MFWDPVGGRFNDFVGRIGYLRELEDTYELGYGIRASPLDERKTKTENDTLRDINKKEESSVTCSNQHDFASQSAQEQALGHLDIQTPVSDTDKSYLQDSSEKKQDVPSLQKKSKK